MICALKRFVASDMLLSFNDMDMEIHFINVGCGNMTLLRFPNGTTWLYDCNVIDEDEEAVLGYLGRVLGEGGQIDVFICSHRDADHMNGIKKVHAMFPISKIRDNDVEGTTTDSSEYRDYMELRRELPGGPIARLTYIDVGEVKVRWMNSKDDRLADPNEQSVVAKVEYKGCSLLLAGDTSFREWREVIMPSYSAEKIKSSILLGAHHGSLTFFDDPDDTKSYYTEHIQAIKPAMTIISVGPNAHGFPDAKAVELYEKYSTGSDKGNKVFSTEDKGNMKLTFKSDGTWSLSSNQ